MHTKKHVISGVKPDSIATVSYTHLETFTVRKFSNGVGVEKTWPLHSPNVEKVEVVRAGKVRRAKLN